MKENSRGEIGKLSEERVNKMIGKGDKIIGEVC